MRVVLENEDNLRILRIKQKKKQLEVQIMVLMRMSSFVVHGFPTFRSKIFSVAKPYKILI